MAKAKNGDTVTVHHTGFLEDGSKFDSSVGKEPLEFTIGSGMMIFGLDKGVIGMEEGESKKIKIAPEDAYGEYDDDLEVVVERSELPDDIEPKIGMTLTTEEEDGQEMTYVITSVSEKHVEVDANHPLAGKELTFELELVKIT